jgi:Fe2+ or Zn2+ uptake regulation protein
LKYPLRNIVLEKIKEVGNLSDNELLSNLEKDGVPISMADLNKTLLDLEIFGLVRVSWLTKDKRRIELVTL